MGGAACSKLCTKMPSVETQTTWSWLKDLSVLSQLASAREELELSLGKQEIIELTRSLGKPNYLARAVNLDGALYSSGWLARLT